MLAKLQQELAQHISTLASPDKKLAEAYLSECKTVSEIELRARLAVHQNNFFYSLIEILQDAFPTIVKLTGKDFFKTLARNFICHSPPNSPLLFEFGVSLPDYIKQLATLEAYPYMSDAALLDWYRHRAYYAENQSPLKIENFSALDPSALSDAKLKFHPSAGIVVSDYAIYSIWESNQSDNSKEIDANIAENVLVLRTKSGIQTYKIEYTVAIFLLKLQNEFSIATALQAAMDYDTDFNAANAIDFLIRSDLCVELNTEKNLPGNPI